MTLTPQEIAAEFDRVEKIHGGIGVADLLLVRDQVAQNLGLTVRQTRDGLIAAWAMHGGG